MNWLKVDLGTYQKVQNINPEKGTLLYNLAPRPYTPTEEDTEEFNGEVLSVRIEKTLNTYELINLLLDLQREFDKSNEVNYFIVEGSKYWLDRDTRVSLINSITIQKDAGLEEVILWLDGKPYKTSADYALSFIRSLELYAMNCNNNTQQHLMEISNLNDRDALFEYNISTGYPEPIVFDTEELVK